MSKWFAFTRNGEQRFVNTDALESIYAHSDGGSWMLTVSGKTIHIDQSVDEIPFLSGLVKKEKKEPKDILPPDTKLSDLWFTKRAENIFKRCELETIGELLAYFAHKDKFKFTRGAGKKTIDEIVGKMNACGYHFTWEDD